MSVRPANDKINIDYNQPMARRSPRLNATETAKRLGVKPATLYAYVSRGYLTRERGPDGRSSLFDAAEVERLALRGRPRRSTRGPIIDVPMETAITLIDGRRLFYRGYDAVVLSRQRSYEEVAGLLWNGTLPGHFVPWGNGLPVPVNTEAFSPVHRIRVAVAAVAATAETLGASPGPTLDHPESHHLESHSDNDPDVAPDPGQILRMAPTLVATVANVVAGPSVSRIPRLRIGDASCRGTVAGRVALGVSTRRPPPDFVALINAALVLLADHELAASTFAARIAASARADAASVLLAGLGAMHGRYHGQASQRVGVLFAEAAAHSAATAIDHLINSPEGPPGFGHPLYPFGDPRAAELLDRLGESGAPPRHLRLVREIVDVAADRGLPRPNVDLALGAVAHSWHLVGDAGEAIFSLARCAGWLAHGAEEYQRRPLRFRVQAAYTGVPPRTF